MLPSISVITPSYNQGQFIGQTIESVLSQGYSRVEYIVVDGLSTDTTPEVLARYGHRLHLIRERDRGQTDAINKGIRRATGEIVCWLNSDDYFLPGTLAAVGQFFETHPDRLWLTGDCRIVNETGQTIQEPVRHYKRLLRALTPAVYVGATNAICQPATFWRRSVHDQLGYLNESLQYTMDYDWWLRILTLQPPAISRAVFTAFRIHGASKGGSRFGEQFAEDYQTLRRHYTSPIVRALHRWHNRAIVALYRRMK